jgi:hypothetical protein
LHSKQTTTDGIHTAIAYVYASLAARLAATGFTPEDIGKLALQSDDNSVWILINNVGPIWAKVTNLTAASTLVLGEAVVAGDLLALNSSSEGRLAESNFSTDRWRLYAVALEPGVATATISVETIMGRVVPIRFGVAPGAGSNGSLVFLSTVPGEAALSPPTSGNAVYAVGILAGANGITTTPDVLFQPRYISRIP